MSSRDRVGRFLIIIKRLPRVFRDERALAPLGAIGFALVFSYPLLGHLGTRGAMSDWDFNYGLLWVPYQTILRFHQLPLWNPYECGGVPMLGNPDSHILTPFFPLVLWLGPFYATHLEIIASRAIAWLGGYVLGRSLGMRPLGAVAVATVFPASSWFDLKMGAGQLWALEWCWAPWALAAAWIAATRNRIGAAALAGGVLALMMLGNGPYPCVFTGTTIAILLAGVALQSASARPIWTLVVIGLFTAGFSALKVLPAFLVGLHHPRPTFEIEINTFQVLLTALFSLTQNVFRGSPNGWGFWEVGAYIGLFAIPALLSLAAPRRAAPWILAVAVLWLLARGDAEPLAIWPFLHLLPPFNSLRLPSRFLVLFVLIVGVLAGFGIDWLGSRLPRWGAIMGVVLIIVPLVDCLLVGPPNLDDLLQYPVPLTQPPQAFHQIAHGSSDSRTLIPAMENIGVVGCYEYTAWSSSVRPADREGYRGEQYLLGPGTIELARWTPNVLRYNVSVPGPSRFVVNQNYDPGWRVVEGNGTPFNYGGLIGVRIPAGTQSVTIAYGGWPLELGAVISILTLLFAAALVMWRRREA